MAPDGRAGARDAESGGRRRWLSRRDSHAAISNKARNSATIFSTQYGDISVQYAEQHYRLEPFGEPRPLAPGTTDQPSRLLDAANEVVPFWGRESEQADLRAWRDRPDAAFSALLLHGPGGQGKTRLANHFAQRSRAAKWQVLRATRDLWMSPGHEDRVPDVPAPGRYRGTLVVIDYAERWPFTDLMRLCQNPSLLTAGVTRLLMLARSERWWALFVNELRRTIAVTADAYPLRSAARDPQDLLRLYKGAWEGFARVLSVPGGSAVPAFLRPPDEMRVLDVHMMALADVYARLDGGRAPGDPLALSAYLLDRERAHWTRMHHDGLAATPPEVIGRTVLAATLLNRMPYRDAGTAVESLGLAVNGTALQIIDDHTRFYPSTSEDQVFEPLAPDRLAEDLIGLEAPGHGLTGRASDPWAAELLSRILDACGPEGVPGNRIRHVVTLFATAAVRWPHLAERQLLPLLRDDPGIAVRAGAPAIAALLEVRGLDAAVMQAIIEQLPAGRHIDYADTAAELAARLAEVLLRREADPARRAAVHHMLGERLANAGLYTGAESELIEAVEMRRNLAVQPHDLIAAEALAESLASLAEVQEARRDLSRALDSATEAQSRFLGMRTYRTDDRLTMATARITEAKARLSARLRRRTQALQEQIDAVAMWRELCAPNILHLPSLARALDAHARYLHRAGLAGQALTVARDAITTWERLAEMAPHRYEAQLALSLDASLRYHTTSTPDANAACVETISRIRALMRQNLYFQVHFCSSARVWAGLLDDHDAALDLLREATSMADGLTRISVTRYGPVKAALLLRFAQIAWTAQERLSDAYTAVQEAESLFTSLTKANPRHEPRLTASRDLRTTIERKLNRATVTRPDAKPAEETHDPEPAWRPTTQRTLGGIPEDQLCRRCAGAGVTKSDSGTEYCMVCGGSGLRSR